MKDLIAAQKNANALKDFMSQGQLHTMLHNTEGEEGEFFCEKLAEMASLVDNMATYGQTDGKGNEAIVVLHYFYGGFDWYITEKDMVAGEAQHQAFGYADMGFPELGLISIAELIANNVSLDLYFEPRTLGEVKKSRGEL